MSTQKIVSVSLGMQKYIHLGAFYGIAAAIVAVLSGWPFVYRNQETTIVSWTVPFLTDVSAI
jgi:hypothetical protein